MLSGICDDNDMLAIVADGSNSVWSGRIAVTLRNIGRGEMTDPSVPHYHMQRQFERNLKCNKIYFIRNILLQQHMLQSSYISSCFILLYIVATCHQ